MKNSHLKSVPTGDRMKIDNEKYFTTPFIINFSFVVVAPYNALFV